MPRDATRWRADIDITAAIIARYSRHATRRRRLRRGVFSPLTRHAGASHVFRLQCARALRVFTRHAVYFLRYPLMPAAD